MAQLETAVILMANDGSGGAGDFYNLTSQIISINSVEWESDVELTRITPGSFSLTIADYDEKLWNWLEARVVQKEGALPPWIFYDVGEDRRFMGFVPLNQCTRFRTERQPTIEAQEWSIMLTNIMLDWTRDFPQVATAISQAEHRLIRAHPYIATVFFGRHFRVQEYLFMDTPRNQPFGYAEGFIPLLPDERNNSWLQRGDQVWLPEQFTHNGRRPIVKITGSIFSNTGNPATDFWTAQTADLRKAYDDVRGNEKAGFTTDEWRYITVTKIGSGFEDVRVFYSLNNIKSDNNHKFKQMALNTVDGLVIGDILETVGYDQKTFTITAIDSRFNMIVVDEDIDIERDEMLYLSETSRQSLVFEDARALLRRAVFPYFEVNLDRFFPAILPTPAFCWLPMKPLTGADLKPVVDIQTTLDGLQINTMSVSVWTDPGNIGIRTNYYRSWVGNPDDGWQPQIGEPTAYANWSNQMVTAPKYLMPYSVARGEWARNEPQDSFFRHRPPPIPQFIPENLPQWIMEYLNLNWMWTPGLWDETVVWGRGNYDRIPKLYCYDYRMMRRYAMDENRMVFIHKYEPDGTWNNSISPNGSQYPGLRPTTIETLIGREGFIIGVHQSGNMSNRVRQLTIAEMPNLTNNFLTVDLPPEIPLTTQMYRLTTTPWANYLITETTYSRIIPAFDHNGRIVSIRIQSAVVTNRTDAQLIPNTFVGIDADKVAIMAKFREVAPYYIEEPKLETHLLILQSFPVNVQPDPTENWTGEEVNEHPSVIETQKILDGLPRTCGVVRDPSRLNRVVGHVGGAMFQISEQLPWTIEKFTPGDMSAMELIEHVCQLMMAIAVPDTEGNMHIISRNLSEPPKELDLSNSSLRVEEAITWDEFAEVIIVEGQDNSFGVAYGTKGGDRLEMSNHPMIWTDSMARAIAKAHAQYFGQPRKVRTQELAWLDSSSPAPWLILGSMPVCYIRCCKNYPKCDCPDNGKNWIITGIEHNENPGSASLRMVESLDPAYGQDYGQGGI